LTLLNGSCALEIGRSYFLDFSCHFLLRMVFLSMALTGKFTAKGAIRHSKLYGKNVPIADLRT
jgi:hypothetical protein